MENMYWIMILDSVVIVSIITAIITGIASLVFIINYYISKSEDWDDNTDTKLFKSILNWLLPIAVVSTLISIFVPNSKQMLTIIGVGGTYEYIKENDTAKQLPDKCIIALDKLMNEYINEDEEN